MKYTITVDRLELLCAGIIAQLENIESNGQTVSINKLICLERNVVNKNPGFHYAFNVMYEKKLFGCLYYSTTGKYHYEHEHTILISVANERLYEKGYSEKLDLLIQALGIQYIKLTILHIAIDGADLIKVYNKLINSAQIKRQRGVDVAAPKLNKKTYIPDSFTLGSRFSDRYVTIYPKQQELAGKEHKPYITDFWERNKLELPDGQKIDRLELRFKKAKQLKDFSADLSELESPPYLASFFKVHGGSYIGFINNRTKKHSSLIDWSVFGWEMLVVKAKRIVHSPVKMSHMTAIKILVQEYSNTFKKSYLTAAVELSNEKRLNDVVAQKVPRWIKEK